MQGEVRLIVRRIGRIPLGIGTVHVDADVDAGHIEDRENAHRHSPCLERTVDLPRSRSFQCHSFRLPGVAFHHPVSDEPVTYPRQHGRLAQHLCQVERGSDHGRRRRVCAYDFQKRHDIRGREEVQADDILRAAGGRRDFADVEG